MESAAHFMLVFGAVLVWPKPAEARSALLLMIFLNAVWVLTDAVYIPLFNLTALDFPARLVVNAILAISLTVSGLARII